MLFQVLLVLSSTPSIGDALSLSSSASASAPLVDDSSLRTIAHGGVAVIHDWLPPSLTASLRVDAQDLFATGYFTPDGLTNTARPKSEQGFTALADRQTFRGGDGWDDRKAGDWRARRDFARRMRQLRRELARGLDRPTLDPEGVRKHEMTYNWYEPGASLGRHLDEHHEETKGIKGWTVPTRRSVTWLVYLNDGWVEGEGGALRCYPRERLSVDTVGAHEGNLQVGWLDGTKPVFLDSWRDDGLSALYCLDAEPQGQRQQQQQQQKRQQKQQRRRLLSGVDFQVPRQPIDFGSYLSPDVPRESFEQISTARLDPRFASAGAASQALSSADASSTSTTKNKKEEQYFMDVTPKAGTLVLFDSVSLPHLVREVTADRQRIAATGWFHEESQFQALV